MMQYERLGDLEFFHYSSTDSTNKRAKEYATPSFFGNALFLADSQTRGRGRLGRSFYSPDQTGLYCSYLFSTDEPLVAFSALTPAVAVVCARVLERHSRQKVGIKWVNDLYVEGKKVCGILTEAVSGTDGAHNKIIVGIGINLSTVSFPEELCGIAGSLGIDVDKRALALEIAKELSFYSKNPKNRSFMEEYTARSVVLGKDVCLLRQDERIYGQVCGFDRDGGLLLKTGDGVKTFIGGEISLRFDERVPASLKDGQGS